MNVREDTDFKTGTGYSVGAGVGKYFGWKTQTTTKQQKANRMERRGLWRMGETQKVRMLRKTSKLWFRVTSLSAAYTANTSVTVNTCDQRLHVLWWLWLWVQNARTVSPSIVTGEVGWGWSLWGTYEMDMNVPLKMIIMTSTSCRKERERETETDRVTGGGGGVGGGWGCWWVVI